MPQLTPGAVVGNRFMIQGILGQGGMATVYLARDQLRGEPVALKVLHEHLAASPSMRERLRREVLAAGRIRHPHALVAYDLHELDGLMALSLPYHPGMTLQEMLHAQGPFSPEALEKLGLELAGALTEAHRHGVVHRDVTPANIMLNEAGSSALTDFGLARLEDVRTMTATGVIGTSGYAAPEIYQDVRADPRSDIYSLGAVLYCAATGKAPFEANNPMGVLKRQLDETFVPLAQVRPDLPLPLVQTIEAMLRRDPEQRPQGARAVLEALERREGAWDPSGDSIDSTQPAELIAESVDLVDGQTLAPSTPSRQSPLDLEPSTGPLQQPFPLGEWTVVVSPRDNSPRARSRRRQRRRLYKGREKTLRDWLPHLEEWRGTPLGDKFQRQALGNLRSYDKWISTEGPEEKLARAIELEVGLPSGALRVKSVMCESRFRLVDQVDADTALRLVRAAQRSGFSAEAIDPDLARSPQDAQAAERHTMMAYFLIPALAMLMAGLSPLVAKNPVLIVLYPPLIFTLIRTLKRGAEQRALDITRLPVAYDRDLLPDLTESHRAMLSAGNSELKNEAKSASYSTESKSTEGVEDAVRILQAELKEGWRVARTEWNNGIRSLQTEWNAALPHADRNKDSVEGAIKTLGNAVMEGVLIKPIEVPAVTPATVEAAQPVASPSPPIRESQKKSPEKTKTSPTVSAKAAPVPTPATPAKVEASTPLGRVHAMVKRTDQQLKALEKALTESSSQMPTEMVRDLTGTLKSLQEKARELGVQALKIQQELDEQDDATDAAAVNRIEARLERLQTLARSAELGGEPDKVGDKSAVDSSAERRELERSLAAHRKNLQTSESLEARLTLSLARLLEIGAAATQSRRDLLREQSPARSASRLLEQLTQEVASATSALEEVEERVRSVPSLAMESGAKASPTVKASASAQESAIERMRRARAAQQSQKS